MDVSFQCLEGLLPFDRSDNVRYRPFKLLSKRQIPNLIKAVLGYNSWYTIAGSTSRARHDSLTEMGTIDRFQAP